MASDIHDKNYVPRTPTMSLTAEHGNVKVVTKLYGAVTPERLLKEQKATDHRADQLDPPKRKERPERPLRNVRVPEENDDDDETFE